MRVKTYNIRVVFGNGEVKIHRHLSRVAYERYFWWYQTNFYCYVEDV